jgi:GntR family transcriptional regulator/MocR family aminotransferase
VDRSIPPPSDRARQAGTDFLQLDVRRAGRGERTRWLTDELRSAIVSGRLCAGEVLPASRPLAAELGVSRGVVTEAYARLADEGLVSGASRLGTRVLPRPGAARAPQRPRPAPAPVPVSVSLDAGPSTALYEEVRNAPARIDLSPGVPDLASFPRAAWLRAERSVLDGAGAARLGYGHAQGTPALRAAISRWIARTRGITAHPDEIVVVAGVAQALSLLAVLLRARGQDTVAVEDPCSLGARQQLAAWGLATPPVPVDARGLQVDRLRRLDPPVVMLTPAHQFPTGVVLDGRRRADLLAWAETGRLVVEDDYDAEHRYDRHPVAALAATHREHVYHASSVSKLLAPALRIGWVVPPPDMLAGLVDAKRDVDLGNATLPQLTLAALMDSGDLERHLRLVRRRHRARRDVMAQALTRHLPAAEVLGAAAGLHLTVLLPPGVPDVALAEACLSAGVKTQPLSWHRQTPGPDGLVLGYAASGPADIRAGVATIAAVARGDRRATKG